MGRGSRPASLVAEVDRQIIGHILFSRMTVETAQAVAAVSLAPMAVLPDHQGRQVGSQLVRRGLAELRDRGERIVIVLGHKEYYPSIWLLSWRRPATWAVRSLLRHSWRWNSRMGRWREFVVTFGIPLRSGCDAFGVRFTKGKLRDAAQAE